MTGGIANAQANQQGNVVIDPYYGFPNFGKSLAESFTIDDAQVKGIGPAGIRIEYLLGDRFGIGVDAIYNNVSVTGTATDTTGFDGMGQPITSTVEGRGVASRLRIHARFNYHFAVNSENLDVYLGLGAGTNQRFYKYFENDVEQTDFTSSGTLLPVSARFAAGMRYYFTENIGVNTELGIGGPIISAGLSLRF